MTFDVVNRKEVIDDGNWAARVMLFERKPDGSHGTHWGSKSWSAPYYWDRHEYIYRNYQIGRGYGEPKEFLLQAETLSTVDIDEEQGASYKMTNIRVLAPDGTTLDRPCDGDYVASCVARGGSAWLANRLTVDGVTFEPGCYANYNGCLAAGHASTSVE